MQTQTNTLPTEMYPLSANFAALEQLKLLQDGESVSLSAPVDGDRVAVNVIVLGKAAIMKDAVRVDRQGDEYTLSLHPNMKGLFGPVLGGERQESRKGRPINVPATRFVLKQAASLVSPDEKRWVVETVGGLDPAQETLVKRTVSVAASKVWTKKAQAASTLQ